MPHSSLCTIVATAVLIGGGLARAAVFHVPAGQSRLISGTHEFESVLIEGFLKATDNTTFITDSFRLTSSGKIFAHSFRGANGSDAEISFFNYTPPTAGRDAPPAHAFVISSSGLVEISGSFSARGDVGGFGGHAYSDIFGPFNTNLDGADGGNGGRGGTLRITGDDVVFGKDFSVVVQGGPGGGGGDAAGLLYHGGDGGDGGAGGSVYINHKRFTLEPGGNNSMNVLGTAGGAGGIGTPPILNDGSEGVRGPNGFWSSPRSPSRPAPAHCY